MVACLACLFCQPAFAAISESDVQSQVDAVGKEAVSGNVLIWFLCAVAFLKISQKIDSFMASLGVNVGHTGGRGYQPQYYQQCRKDSDNLIGIQAIGQCRWSGSSSTGGLRWRWR